MGLVQADGCRLYYEERGDGVPILLIPPAGSTASTWGVASEKLAGIGRVIVYDRRGNSRSTGKAATSVSRHAADAAAILEHLGTPPAAVVGTSAGATIAIDLAVHRPDLVRVVVAHEAPWRMLRHVPTRPQFAALARIASLTILGRPRDAAEALLRFAYGYRNGGSAWDAFPEEWRRIARENARSTLFDFLNSIRSYPPPKDLATIHVPVVCTYGARSSDRMRLYVESLAHAIPTGTIRRIEGAGHAAPFDAAADFVRVIAEAIAS